MKPEIKKRIETEFELETKFSTPDDEVVAHMRGFLSALLMVNLITIPEYNEAYGDLKHWRYERFNS